MTITFYPIKCHEIVRRSIVGFFYSIFLKFLHCKYLKSIITGNPNHPSFQNAQSIPAPAAQTAPRKSAMTDKMRRIVQLPEMGNYMLRYLYFLNYFRLEFFSFVFLSLITEFREYLVRNMEFTKASLLQILQNQEEAASASLSATERSSLFQEREQLVEEFGLPVNDVRQAEELNRKLSAPSARQRLAVFLSEKATKDLRESAAAVMSAIFTFQAGTLFTRTGKSSSNQNKKVSLEKSCPNIVLLVKGKLLKLILFFWYPIFPFYLFFPVAETCKLYPDVQLTGADPIIEDGYVNWLRRCNERVTRTNSN